MSGDRWKNLEIWKLADSLAFLIYKLTKQFPKEEMFGITSQLRRSSLSIPTNIVEGYSRRGDKELTHFINISLGSLAEVKYLVYFSQRLDYIKTSEKEKILNDCNVLGKKLWRFYEKIRR